MAERVDDTVCSYCGCQSVACIGRFMAEHDDLVNLTGTLRRACATGDPQLICSAADGVAAVLTPHTQAEEVGLFAVLREQEEFAEHIDLLCAEHLHIEELLASVRAGRSGDFRRLEGTLRAHIDREDNGLFPAAAIAFAGPEWDRVHELTPPRPAAHTPGPWQPGRVHR